MHCFQLIAFTVESGVMDFGVNSGPSSFQLIAFTVESGVFILGGILLLGGGYFG
jgi:hypothetical protein